MGKTAEKLANDASLSYLLGRIRARHPYKWKSRKIRMNNGAGLRVHIGTLYAIHHGLVLFVPNGRPYIYSGWIKLVPHASIPTTNGFELTQLPEVVPNKTKVEFHIHQPPVIRTATPAAYAEAVIGEENNHMSYTMTRGEWNVLNAWLKKLLEPKSEVAHVA